MRESLCLYGLLLFGLLVARGWGRHEDFYDYCDDPYFYDYYGLCDDHGEGGGSSGGSGGSGTTTEPPTEPPVCEFPGPTPPNATELEVAEMALCHVHCIDQYYDGSDFNLEVLPGYPNWNIIPRNLLHNNRRGVVCPAFLQLLDCRRGCIIQSLSSSSNCVQTCAHDECGVEQPNTTVPPCGLKCSEVDCGTGCGAVFDTVVDRGNTTQVFPTELNPVAPPSLTQLQDENNQPIARYMVDISGAILSQQPDTRGSFSTLVFQVQNASSEDLYYYWVEEDELNLEAFNHAQVNIAFAVITVQYGISSYSPALTLNVEAIDPELDFPEQLTADNISFSYTVNDRLFEHVDVVISWEKPEGFERATGYTVKISSALPNPDPPCGIPMDYEVGPTQTSLALESNETTHPFITKCFYNIQVIVNPRCPSDEIGENVLAPPGYAGVVRNEIRDNAAISCPEEFDDTSFRYSVNLAWTLPVSPIILESINRFIIRTVRVNALDPTDPTGFFGDAIPIPPNTDPSRTSYSFPITYAPIYLPNTAYNNSLQVLWNSGRSASLPITNFQCHIGTLPPAAPGEVMDFLESEMNIEEEYSAGRRTVVVDVDYTWSNQQTPDEIPVTIDYQVAFVSDSPLSPGASSTGLLIDPYPEDRSTGFSRRSFPTAEPKFNAYLQIRARASYSEGDNNPRVLVGNWSDPIVFEVDIFEPPVPEEIQNLTIINSAILDTIFIPESASVLVSVQVDFEWIEPMLNFGAIQEYEAWLNFRSLGEDENPENGTFTFGAGERAGTITADFTMAVADGPATLRLMLQMRSTSEFGSSIWNDGIDPPIELITDSPPTPDPISSDAVSFTLTRIERRDSVDLLEIDIAIELDLPELDTLNVTRLQAFVGPNPIAEETDEQKIAGYITDFDEGATSGNVQVELRLSTLQPMLPPEDNTTANNSVTRTVRQVQDDLLDEMPEMDTLFIQVRARNEFIAGNWSDPLELNYTVPPIAVVTDGNRQSDNTVEIAVPIAATIAVFLIIAIIGLLIWLGYKKRQSNKWNDYLREGNEEEGARLASLEQRSAYPLAPLPTDKTLLLDEWEVSANDVIVEQQLGEGAFGEVFKGAMRGPLLNPKISSALKQTIGLPVAIKLLKTSATGRERSDFLSEIEMMKKIAEGNNPHIVNMIGCVTIQEPLCLITEFVPHGDLLSYIRNRRKRSANKRRKKHKLFLTKPAQPYPSLEPRPQETPTIETQESVKAGSPDSQLALLPETAQDTTQDTQDAQQPPKTDLEDSLNQDVAAPYLEPTGEYSLLDPKPAEAVAAEEEEEEDEDPYGELGDLVANDLIQFAYQIATGMEHLASLKIVHRDLACRNILIGDGKKLKIADFGLSREVEEVYVKKTKGRLPLKWMAIECIVDREFTTLSDVWAYGVTLWEIGTLGGFPYPTVPNQDLLNMLKQGYRLEKPDNCAPAVYEIMLECWNEDPQDRPTFPDLRTKFGALLIAGKEDQYISLEVDEMKPCYNVQEEEEEESSRRERSSSEESIDKIKGKKEEHKELKTKPSNPYVDHPARQPLQSQTSQPASMHSQPSLQSQPSQPAVQLRGPAIPSRPANTLVDDVSFGTDPYFDQLAARPVPQPSQGSVPEEEMSLGISIAQLQSQQSSHEGLERRTTNPYVEDPSSVPTSSITHTNGLLETSLTSSLPTVKEVVHAGPNGDVATDEPTGIET